MKRRYYLYIMLFLIAIVVGIASMSDFEYAYIPDEDTVVDHSHNSRKGLDIWGTFISEKNDSIQHVSSKNEVFDEGAIKIDNELLKLGREVFYEETFGNEIFLTDIMGIINGPLTIGNMSKAILALKGEGTTNLRVELAKDITIGETHYKKGDLIDTGIDVARGSLTPLGLPVSWADGRVRVGISCAACHATVDPVNKNVIENAPNADFNAGLVMALASNSTAFFSHAEIKSIEKYVLENSPQVIDSTGKVQSLPDSETIEREVDRIVAQWPRGNFDSTIDLVANPCQIPDAYTLGDHPYGWSGFSAAGPFKGLSSFSNNVHAQNADSLSQMEISQELVGIDPEVYVGMILQNAANPEFRYMPSLDVKPTEFFKSVDPTPGVVGVNDMVAQPLYPKVSIVAPAGLFVSENGFKFNEQNYAASAWQNTINPPKPKLDVSKEQIDQGREVFIKGGCISCHAGNNLTNNSVVSTDIVGTEPSRAKGLSKTEKVFGESYLYAPDTPVPLPENPKVLKVPTQHLDPEQIKLAFGHDNSAGGYKVPSLIGLYWTAPYLHDGGVAIGTNGEFGMKNTLLKGISPDPKNSLMAMIDRELRQKVIEENKSSESLRTVRVTGEGHAYWIDGKNGFTNEEQEAVVGYLLSLYKQHEEE
ncbi:mono/diheme cytochrome c family protein [Bacillus mesophilus]|uniref:Electron transport protein n=1 Tax=Bacillus mesophilus TaxID=1808955 RepID=A0A6M0QBZ6_9BACI|nr:electron transport protein [Bacillus mesophilus]MBM7662330.1 mono/diheme cytochrome c family protein [Bacillus mesophilus]NEY73040.1 electron transport protein [Bacillus mesophilus]